jgi:hypothetical protein
MDISIEAESIETDDAEDESVKTAGVDTNDPLANTKSVVTAGVDAYTPPRPPALDTEEALMIIDEARALDADEEARLICNETGVGIANPPKITGVDNYIPLRPFVSCHCDNDDLVILNTGVDDYNTPWPFIGCCHYDTYDLANNDNDSSNGDS